METWVEEIGKIMSIRRYRLSNLKKDMVICEGSTEWVFVDSKKMRPIKIPEVVVEAFKKDLKLL
jgi:acyl-CoA thioester hydrolase